MSGRLNRKICVVTAAGQGIGRAIAEAFVREGRQVWATDLDPTKLADLRDARTVALNVRSTDAINALAAETGGIDVLVNAAGYVHHGSVLDCSEEDWDLSFDLNVKSMHRMLRAFLPGMLERGNWPMPPAGRWRTSLIRHLASGGKLQPPLVFPHALE